jgi:hypothetical protein
MRKNQLNHYEHKFLKVLCVIEIVNYHLSVFLSLAVKPLAPLVQKFVLKKKQVFTFFMLSSSMLYNSWLKRQTLQKISDDRCSGSELYGKVIAPDLDLEHNLTIPFRRILAKS